MPAGHHNMHLGWSMGMTQVQGDQYHGAWTWAVCVDPGPLGHMMDSPCAWAVLRSISNDPGLLLGDLIDDMGITRCAFLRRFQI